ncbi:hypothetical protein H2200_003565 [Cladophialophora chaetospira]|uniref:Uncharacterized protein n=1 Tax=Cladophialophora chaetospira TaxID=386627 RepID=A0AA38XEF7_9EURO|nr:hypothetical protein H2200_003565 [Cladophialophora chaetospira]
MDSLQQQYWAQYEDALEDFLHGSEQQGIDLCISSYPIATTQHTDSNSQLNLRRRIDMGLYLRAMVNASLATLSQNIADKLDFANEFDHARGLVARVTAEHELAAAKKSSERDAEQAEDEDIETVYLPSPVIVEQNLSWEGLFTRHWKAAKERDLTAAGIAAKVEQTQEEDSDQPAADAEDSQVTKRTESTQPTSQSSAVRGDEEGDEEMMELASQETPAAE